MLRWPGDYTTQRLRAKLAEKYKCDPGVEPDYAEVYMPELGTRTVLRKDHIDASRRFEASGSLSMSSSTGALRGSKDLANSTWRSRSGRLDASMTLRSPSSLGSSSTGSLPRLARDMSSPMLSMRRMEVPPASWDPSMRGKMLASSSSTAFPSAPSSPITDPDKRKEAEAAEKEKAACKQFWTACWSGRPTFEMQLAQMKMDTFGAKPDDVKFMSSIRGLSAKDMKAVEPPESVKKALKAGAKIDWQNDEYDGGTLLLKSVRCGELELAMWLISKEADHTLTDRSGRGILHWAAIEGSPSMMEFLLSLPEVDANTGDNGGDTPLHLAAFHGHLTVVRLLVHKQADPDVRNSEGFTPYDLAKARRYWTVARYLDKSDKKQREDDMEIDPEAPEYSQLIPKLRRAADLAKADEVFNEECEFLGKWDDMRELKPICNADSMLVRDDKMVEKLHEMARNLVSPPKQDF